MLTPTPKEIPCTPGTWQINIVILILKYGGSSTVGGDGETLEISLHSVIVANLTTAGTECSRLNYSL